MHRIGRPSRDSRGGIKDRGQPVVLVEFCLKFIDRSASNSPDRSPQPRLKQCTIFLGTLRLLTADTCQLAHIDGAIELNSSSSSSEIEKVHQCAPKQVPTHPRRVRTCKYGSSAGWPESTRPVQNDPGYSAGLDFSWDLRSGAPPRAARMHRFVTAID